ncbi:uroporphyrinogen-III synthase [Joostella sp. CR20]|uniref:uroporphyrinogen-III synthase n=1 Tax=Joostella sp. CR20 TaxID=2804312 RepID=UPI00313BBD21
MIEILSTKKLTNTQKNILEKENIKCIDEDFISIQPKTFESPTLVENAIFTSKNAVKSIIKSNITIHNCFCVGDKTEAYLIKNGYTVVEKSYQAKALAEQIIKNHADKNFTLFCGNIRREELPNLLNENKIKLKEIEVYDTILTSKNMIRTFDGVLFFSPSAVESYSQRNLFENTTVFCLGKTTEAAAREHTNNIITANRSTVENVLVQVIKHFK